MKNICIDLFFQAQARQSESHRERQSEAKLSTLYYRNIHTKFYYFCQ